MLTWLVRIGARILDVVVGPFAPRLLPLDPGALVARAQRRAGLSDLGQLPYPDALQVLCASLERDANLSVAGRLALREHITLALQTRLELIAREKEEGPPQAALRRPIIVLGLPRSGTTFLHRLLVEVEGARGLKTWEIRRPLPPRRGPDRRRLEAHAAISFLRAMAPEVDAKHKLGADEVEEGVGLFDSSLWSPAWWRLAAVHGYLDWYLSQDPTEGYRTYRRMLEYFQAASPESRLTLKLPNHLGFIGTLASVIPEACIVQTHRDPVPVIASYNSLMSSVHGTLASDIDRVRIGQRALEMWGTLADRCLAQREQLAPDAILDVDYDALVQDPVASVRRIYAHFDLPWPEGTEERLQALVSERTQHRYGRHRYALEDAQLTSTAVASRFEIYCRTHLPADPDTRGSGDVP